jgi:predicted nucleic acid-binding Zn ribbon protein
MDNFINNPIKNSYWDPSKGDFVDQRVCAEDKLYQKRQKNKKTFIAVLALTHILLLFIIFIIF